MRPKVVILTLVGAFVALGVIALMKGIAGKDAGHGDAMVTSNGPSDTRSNDGANTNQSSVTTAGSASTVPVSDEMRAAVIEKEVGQIHTLQGEADGTNNPVVIAALIDKLSNPEGEVRQTALDALKQLDDTNAVPGLQKAVDNIKDPREKVAILDVIDYIKLPDATANVPPELMTNHTDTSLPPIISTNARSWNPNFLKSNPNIHLRDSSQQPAAADSTPPAMPAQQPQ